MRPSNANVRNVSASIFGIAALSPHARKPLPKFVRQRLISGGTEVDFLKNFGNFCDEKCTHKFKQKNIQICATEIDFLCDLNWFFSKNLIPFLGSVTPKFGPKTNPDVFDYILFTKHLLNHVHFSAQILGSISDPKTGVRNWPVKPCSIFCSDFGVSFWPRNWGHVFSKKNTFWLH